MGKWNFEQKGQPFSFEQVSRYSEKIKSKRFDFSLMKQYLAAMRLFPFEIAFYLPNFEDHAILIEFKEVDKNKNKYRRIYSGYPRCKQTGYYAFAKTSSASKASNRRSKERGILLRNKDFSLDEARRLNGIY